jgi:hypothetical protein
MAELMQEQRELLKTISKKDNISDELIRQQPDLPDLEEEKMMRRFAYYEE